jgi:hypothetical protein
VSISIDELAGVILRHVERCGWTQLTHYSSGEPGTGGRSPAEQAFVASGVPTAFLIDQQGTIVWRGHPATIDVGARIDELLRKAGS